MFAYVYLLEEIPNHSGESGPWTKIGFSQNPPKWRINANLKRGNPRTLNLAATFQFETRRAAFEAEQAAHAHFSCHAHEREWFNVSWNLVAQWLREVGAREQSTAQEH